MRHAYESLANAVVLQAIEDYRNGGREERAEYLEFFQSDRIVFFTDICGENIIKRLPDAKKILKDIRTIGKNKRPYKQTSIETVKEIRAIKDLSDIEIANKYGIGSRTVYNIRTRRTFKNI